MQLSHKYALEIKNILKTQLTKQKIYLFGSRAKNTAEKFSDVDLCIDGDSISFEKMSLLKDAFSESDIPYFVDIVQKQNLSDDFYTQIKPSFIEI